MVAARERHLRRTHRADHRSRRRRRLQARPGERRYGPREWDSERGREEGRDQAGGEEVATRRFRRAATPPSTSGGADVRRLTSRCSGPDVRSARAPAAERARSADVAYGWG